MRPRLPAYNRFHVTYLVLAAAYLLRAFISVYLSEEHGSLIQIQWQTSLLCYTIY